MTVLFYKLIAVIRHRYSNVTFYLSYKTSSDHWHYTIQAIILLSKHQVPRCRIRGYINKTIIRENYLTNRGSCRHFWYGLESLIFETMLTILVAALLSVDLVDAAGFQIGRTVKTSSGDITGQPSSWKPEVSEYLGIRYAQPPVGKLRFAAPIALKAAGEAVNATKYVRNLSYIDSSDQPQGP
jgi:hypothetical protein